MDLDLCRGGEEGWRRNVRGGKVRESVVVTPKAWLRSEDLEREPSQEAEFELLVFEVMKLHL